MEEKQFIFYDNTAPTAWLTLLLLAIGSVLLINHLQAEINAYELESQTVQETKEERKPETEVRIVTTQEVEREEAKQAFLADLRHCESSGYDNAIGDGGASIGPYQWQKPTLEDKLGTTMSYNEYYAIVTNYDRIHKLTYETYFEDGEWWRWYNCTNHLKTQHPIIESLLI